MKSRIVPKIGGYRQEAHGEISIDNIGMRRMVLTRVSAPVSWTSEDRVFKSLENEVGNVDIYVSNYFLVN